jgi:glyoxylase-like metal-dependent hydrolase (beta-lactamase superfamily II)/rubredoxin
MIIKAIQFRKNGFYTAPFIFGGEDGPENYDIKERYRGSLQNYLIDTGKEVILVDTAIPKGTPEEVPNENSPMFTGLDSIDYIDGLKQLGYMPEQVSKIILTHKHGDHSGRLKDFPNAQIFVNEDECCADELKGLNNIVSVKFKSGAFYNFPDTEEIAPSVHMIKAKGHTNGNSMVIVEDKEEGIFYMFQGDITYTDEALYRNKLSVVYEDLKEARITLDRVREFVCKHPTVYMGTHTPQGPENLEAKRIIDLNNPVETIPVGDITFKTKTGKYVCSICGYVYDPAKNNGIAFDDLPEDWKCPRCKQPKTKFNEA